MMKRTVLRCLSGFLLAVLLIPVSSHAQVPSTLAYQGYLTDTDGAPLGGTVNLAFRLYDAPTSGTVAWAESQLNVPVSDGVFSVQLGQVENLSGVAFEQPLWLAVQVNGGIELAPRVALTAAPYSLATRGLRVIPADEEDDAPSIVAGDASNTVAAGNEGATISGGSQNAALDCYDTVAGGRNNRAEGLGFGSKVSGFVCGATVGGGSSNVANNEVATVAGGRSNTASGSFSTVGGGGSNTASGSRSTVSGGDDNTASGGYSTIPGGSDNTAAGNYSFAAGREAEANHDGTFVWSDANAEGFASTAENQFLIRATGGVGIGTNTPQGALHVTHENGGMDLILGGTEDSLFGDDGRIASDPAFPSSDLWLVSNDALAIFLDADDSGEDSAFLISDTDFDIAFQVDLSGTATTGSVLLENDLGQGTTLEDGGVYHDNVVYAWAHVNTDGTVAASFGCTVLKTGTGLYRVTYDVPLTNGAAPVVTPLSANDPVMAVVSPGGTTSANVKIFGFVGGQFITQDRPFFIQVTGRP